MVCQLAQFKRVGFIYAQQKSPTYNKVKGELDKALLLVLV